MFKYFFVQEADLPPEALGFPMFGTAHLLILTVIFIAGYFMCRAYKRLTVEKQNRIGIIMCVVMLLEEGLRDYILWRLGHFGIEFYPLHLCGLALFVCFFHSLTRFDWLGQSLFCLCMPGALCALLFPDWTRCPLLQFECIHSFFIHALLTIYPMMQLVSGRIKPKLTHGWKAAAFIVVTSIPLGMLNKRFGTNFMFLSYPSPGSPLVLIERIVGEKYYVAGFAVFAFVCVLVFYGIYYLIDFAQGKSDRTKRGKQTA